MAGISAVVRRLCGGQESRWWSRDSVVVSRLVGGRNLGGSQETLWLSGISAMVLMESV